MTELIDAIQSNNASKALAIIATGKSNPGHEYFYCDTAFIWACVYKMTAVAMALLATGKSNPGHIVYDGNTVLILACMREMPVVALALIATGKSNPEQFNNNGDTALIIAKLYNLEEVVDALEHYDEFMAKHAKPIDDTSSEQRIYIIEL